MFSIRPTPLLSSTSIEQAKVLALIDTLLKVNHPHTDFSPIHHCDGFIATPAVISRAPEKEDKRGNPLLRSYDEEWFSTLSPMVCLGFFFVVTHSQIAINSKARPGTVSNLPTYCATSSLSSQSRM